MRFSIVVHYFKETNFNRLFNHNKRINFFMLVLKRSYRKIRKNQRSITLALLVLSSIYTFYNFPQEQLLYDYVTKGTSLI
jgi:hypothetical protein